jgi:branched-chain amino acid transport system ATP-binding protein
MNDNYLVTTDLCKYFGGLKAVKNVSFAVKKNQLKAIIGPNGAGKTTFFNLLSGLYPPTNGRIYFEGVDIAKRKMHEISRMGITRTFQITHIFQRLTVFENIRIAAQSRKTTFNFLGRASAIEDVNGRALEILEQVKLTEVKNHKASMLSHGDRKYLQIGIALATNPKILLLDEPTAGMSPAETLEATELLRGVKDKLSLTIVLVEHDMSVVMGICDEVVVLHEGEILAEGTPQEISDHDLVQRIYLGESNAEC